MWKENNVLIRSIYYLDLTNYICRSNKKLDCIIFINLGLDTDHLWTNWNQTLFSSLFSVFCITV